MKKLLFTAVAASLMMASCNNADETSIPLGSEQTTTLGIALPDAFKSMQGRAGNAYVDSGLGSLTNQPGVDVTVYVEILYGATSVFSANQTVTTDTPSVTFNPTLVTGETYSLVAWAQYGASAPTGLTDIAITPAINDESTDAFFYAGDLVAAPSMSATLTRPFGKLRLIAADYGVMNTQTGRTVESVTVTYNSGRFTKFDAATGTFSDANTVTVYTADMNTYSADPTGSQTLFADYLAVPAGGATMFPFTIEVTYDDQTTYTRAFTQDIPVKRNGLTTLTGNFFTTQGALALTIVDDFDSVESIEYWDSETATEVEPDVDGNFVITTPSELLWFADEVNGGNTFAGETVMLGADIDLANAEWAPIGNASMVFLGTFDGDGYTISNLKVSGGQTDSDADNYKGLFGHIDSPAVLKNFTINNATVSGGINVSVVCGMSFVSSTENVDVTGHVELTGLEYVGTISGYGYNTMSDCDVNVDETSFVLATESFAGGISGYNGESAMRTAISDCTTNIDVTGYTYVGGLTGICQYGVVIQNSTATCDVTSTATASTEVSELYGVGGLVGITVDNGTYLCQILNCTFTGTITNSFDAANIIHDGVVGSSFAGLLAPTNLVITGCVINGMAVN